MAAALGFKWKRLDTTPKAQRARGFFQQDIEPLIGGRFVPHLFGHGIGVFVA